LNTELNGAMDDSDGPCLERCPFLQIPKTTPPFSRCTNSTFLFNTPAPPPGFLHEFSPSPVSPCNLNLGKLLTQSSHTVTLNESALATTAINTSICSRYRQASVTQAHRPLFRHPVSLVGDDSHFLLRSISYSYHSHLQPSLPTW
jgi:hypothetical protein